MSSDSMALILRLLDECRDLALATVRVDGTPHASTVNFSHNGLTLYFATRRESQKVRNLQLCDKVSVAMRADYSSWSSVRGLSITATARVLPDDDPESQHARDCLARRFRHEPSTPSPQDQTDAVFVAIVPSEIRVIDYSRGYGHQDLVRVPGPH